MMYGAKNPVYERALESHARQAKIHNYSMNVLRQKMLGRLWTKPAYLLSIVLAELTKPPEERLEWLFWFDADTFLLNPEIPLEIFLPSKPSLSHVHFLCGNDHNGLNDGAFLLRVNDFAVHMLSAALSVETYKPKVDLKYSEQSAIEHVVTSDYIYKPWDGTTYLDGHAQIPQRWLNAYMGARDDEGFLAPGKKLHPNNVREGDLLLHFVGSGDTKRERMSTFMDSYEGHEDMWIKGLDDLQPLLQEIEDFWTKFARGSEDRKAKQKALKEALELKGKKDKGS